MKTVLLIILLLILLSGGIPGQSHAQIIEKFKILLNPSKEVLPGETKKNKNEDQTRQKSNSKKHSLPDVKKYLADSRHYLNTKKYIVAKVEIQQAPVGAELLLGIKNHDEMPKEIIRIDIRD
jgi:hypothetical protein